MQSRVVVLDHHKTALETLPSNGTGPPNLQILLDMKRSGATIAYDYFVQRLQAHSPSQTFLHDDKAPRLETLFKYIQDADLWTWALPDSKPFSSGLSDSRIEYSVLKNAEVFDQVQPGKLVLLRIIEETLNRITKSLHVVNEMYG